MKKPPEAMICQKCKRQYNEVRTYGSLASSMNERLCPTCAPSIIAQQVQDGTITPEEGIAKLTARDPSVSPEDGGVARQRRTPKPGIPHFRFSYLPVTRKTWFIALNHEVPYLMTMLLRTSEYYELIRGGIIRR